MKVIKNKRRETSTEEKIKAAAKKLFTQRGYSEVKTRDIVKEAGINLSLLNYYFRSKEKLFEIVMQENRLHFMEGMEKILNDRSTDMNTKIEMFVSNFIDLLTLYPDMSLFMFNQMRKEPKKIAPKVRLLDTYFMKQIKEGMEKGIIKTISPYQFIMNLFGLSIFPFIFCPMIKYAGGLSDKQFNALMQERKKMVPLWVRSMMKVK